MDKRKGHSFGPRFAIVATGSSSTPPGKWSTMNFMPFRDAQKKLGGAVAPQLTDEFKAALDDPTEDNVWREKGIIFGQHGPIGTRAHWGGVAWSLPIIVVRWPTCTRKNIACWKRSTTFA